MEVLSIKFLEEKSLAKLQSLAQYLHKESFTKNMVELLRKQKLALCDDNIKKVLLGKSMITKFRTEIKKLTGMTVGENEALDLISDCLK